MAVIDIGSAATDRTYATELYTYTYIFLTNPANDSGTITTIEIWANTELSNVEVATFYLVSGSNYSTRDTHTIGTVTAGSKQTFSGLSIDVQAGDCLGLYSSGGQIESDNAGGSGSLLKSGDNIPCTNQTFEANEESFLYSLYGTGATAGGIKWNGLTISKWNGVTISKWNGMV